MEAVYFWLRPNQEITQQGKAILCKVLENKIEFYSDNSRFIKELVVEKVHGASLCADALIQGHYYYVRVNVVWSSPLFLELVNPVNPKASPMLECKRFIELINHLKDKEVYFIEPNPYIRNKELIGNLEGKDIHIQPYEFFERYMKTKSFIETGIMFAFPIVIITLLIWFLNWLK